MGIAGSGRFQYQPPSGGKPVGLIKGRPASIFRGEGNGSRLVDPNKANEEENDEHAMEETKGAEISYKRSRDEEVADHTTVNADDEQRLAKKSRQEMVQTALVPAETEVDATNHIIIVDSDPERKEDIQHGQDHDELPPGEEAMQDASGVNGIPLGFNDVINDGTLQTACDYKVMQDASGVDGLQQECDNVVNDGTLQTTNGYEEPQPGHNAAGEENTLQTINDNDGLAAPCNSDAGDEEGDDQTEAVDNTAQGNNDRAIINLTEIEDEIQVNEFNDGDGVNEDVEAPEPISAEDRRARASAASIYDETNHGVDFVPNSQAALIDTVKEAKARVRARAKMRMERQDKLNAQLAVEPEPDSDVSEY
ncbi:hypothetical protein HD806DRAFT_518028 [Xylariaceae sp. AK1471]|nr:hypothetical protein HD806DRAFT_518028 [Xylariaceae sp. AK1471]